LFGCYRQTTFPKGEYYEIEAQGRLEAEADNRETSNNSNNDSFEQVLARQVLARRFARRNFIKGAAVSTSALERHLEKLVSVRPITRKFADLS